MLYCSMQAQQAIAKKKNIGLVLSLTLETTATNNTLNLSTYITNILVS